MSGGGLGFVGIEGSAFALIDKGIEELRRRLVRMGASVEEGEMTHEIYSSGTTKRSSSLVHIYSCNSHRRIINYSPGDSREKLTIMNIIEGVLVEGDGKMLMDLLEFRMERRFVGPFVRFTSIGTTGELSPSASSICIEASKVEDDGDQWLVKISGRCRDRGELVEMETRLEWVSRFLDEYFMISLSAHQSLAL